MQQYPPSFVINNKFDTLVNRGISGTGYVRSSGNYSQDFEGLLKYSQPNCPAFPGLRLVSNLLTWSEDFSNAAWAYYTTGTGTVTKTPNYATAPDGTQTACRVLATKGTGMGVVTYAVTGLPTASSNRGPSCWIKSNTGVNQNIEFGDGQVYSGQLVVTPTWQRYFKLFTGASINGSFDIGSSVGSDASVDVSIWHPQYENLTGASNQNPSEYLATTSAPLSKWKDYLNPNTVDGNGVVTDSGVRIPITFPAWYKGLLSEPGGVNLINNAIAPATQTITVSAVQHTLSIMGTGTCTLSGVATGNITGTSATDIKTLTFTPTAGSLVVTLSGGHAITALQVETGATNTSFMLSSGTTSTRAATVDGYVSTDNISDTVGTIFAVFTTSNPTALFQSILSSYNGGTGGVPIGLNNTVLSLFDGAAWRSLNSGLSTVGGTYKCCVRWSGVVCTGFVNGVKSADATFDGSLNMNATMNIGGNTGAGAGTGMFTGGIGTVQIFNTALSDAQCIALTS
jgi:hypothetical protein